MVSGQLASGGSVPALLPVWCWPRLGTSTSGGGQSPSPERSGAFAACFRRFASDVFGYLKATASAADPFCPVCGSRCYKEVRWRSMSIFARSVGWCCVLARLATLVSKLDSFFFVRRVHTHSHFSVVICLKQNAFNIAKCSHFWQTACRAFPRVKCLTSCALHFWMCSA